MAALAVRSLAALALVDTVGVAETARTLEALAVAVAASVELSYAAVVVA